MKKSLGIIEVKGLPEAIVIADVMVKATNVEVDNLEITKGFGYITIIISGNIAAVNAALDSGKMMAMKNNSYVGSKVIARPSIDVENIFLKEKEELTENLKDNTENVIDINKIDEENSEIIDEKENNKDEKDKDKDDDIEVENKIDSKKKLKKSTNSKKKKNSSKK